MFNLRVPDSLAYIPGRVHVLSDYEPPPEKKRAITREEKLRRQRASYAANRASILARRKELYKAKPRRPAKPRLEQMAEYYRTHREQIAAQRKRKRQQLKEAMK